MDGNPSNNSNEEIVSLPTVEELNLSISKLEANRDSILLEKRAIAEAKSGLQEELDASNSKLSALEVRHTAKVKDDELNTLLNQVGVVTGSLEFIKHKIKDLVTVDSEYKVVLKDFNGNESTREGLIKLIKDNRENARHLSANVGSGAGSQGSGATGMTNSNDNSGVKKPNVQFGLR